MSTIRSHAAGEGSYPIDEQLIAVLDAMPTLVWLAAPGGEAVHVGRRWLEYTGCQRNRRAAGGGRLPPIRTTSTA